MRRMLLAIGLTTGIAGVLCEPRQALASVISYTDRTPFEVTLDNIIKDDYENVGYLIQADHPLSDAAMSAVLAETTYESTGFPNHNMIEIGIAPNDHEYCAGCNGSYLLGFTSTSISGSGGVFGVGFDYYDFFRELHAFITFGDGSTADFAMTDGATRYDFFGVTSELGIRSVHLGLADGGPTQKYSFTQDNLTIGNSRNQAPEPASLALLGLSLAGLALSRKFG